MTRATFKKKVGVEFDDVDSSNYADIMKRASQARGERQVKPSRGKMHARIEILVASVASRNSDSATTERIYDVLRRRQSKIQGPERRPSRSCGVV